VIQVRIRSPTSGSVTLQEWIQPCQEEILKRKILLPRVYENRTHAAKARVTGIRTWKLFMEGFVKYWSLLFQAAKDIRREVAIPMWLKFATQMTPKLRRKNQHGGRSLSAPFVSQRWRHRQRSISAPGVISSVELVGQHCSRYKLHLIRSYHNSVHHCCCDKIT
jgi:hypothetical protein